MSNEISQEGSDLIALLNTHNSTIAITKISDSKYEEWNKQLERERKYLNRLSEDEIDERQATLKCIQDLEKKIEEYENYARKLLREANRVKGIHSRRLKQAKELINNGEIEKAREFYLEKKAEIIEERNENLEKRIILSQEFLMMALLSQSDYENPDYSKQIFEYFNLSIESYETKQNLFHYAVFLYEHNKYQESETCFEIILKRFSEQLSFAERAISLNAVGLIYRKQLKFEQGEKILNESLKIFREIYKQEPNNLDLASIALVLNSLGLIYSNQWKLEISVKIFNEAIKIWRKVCNEEKETYKPYLAMALNNIGIVHKDLENYNLSETKYFEAIKIRRQLASKNENLYLQDLANSLSNLGILYRVSSDAAESKIKAKHNILEAIAYYEKLSQFNPEKYLISFAKAYINLGNIYRDLEEFKLAETNYFEALEIINQISDKYSQIYLIEYSSLTANLAKFYQDSIVAKEHSVLFAIRTYLIAYPLANISPDADNFSHQAITILRNWGFSIEEIEKMISDELNSNKN